MLQFDRYVVYSDITTNSMIKYDGGHDKDFYDKTTMAGKFQSVLNDATWLYAISTWGIGEHGVFITFDWSTLPTPSRNPNSH